MKENLGSLNELININNSTCFINNYPRFKMSDDDVPQLSASTLAALQEFYAEQAINEEKTKAIVHNPHAIDQNIFQADWQLSQFWYNEETAQKLAAEAIRATNSGKIALISCPTLYPKLKSLSPEMKVVLLEYDKRFAVYDGFIYYDYKEPLNVPKDLHGFFDIVIADPPFLSEECLSRISETVKLLAKDKVILCTGAVMENLVKQLLNLDVRQFQPKHNCNLANEFRCYANYDIDEYIFSTTCS